MGIHLLVLLVIALVLVGSALLLLTCARSRPGPVAAEESEEAAARARRKMVQQQIRRRNVEDPRVLAAMEKVPRHRFVPRGLRSRAYEDHPLPISHGQTISQPYIVALMTELTRVKPGDKVLEVGTGSGYQAAVLAELAGQVFTIEIVKGLAEQAAKTLAELGYEKVHTRHGDGFLGWPKEAPFDAILVTAAPREVPQPLLDQLAPGGRMCVPVGPQGWGQDLRLIVKDEQGRVRSRDIIPVRFVPLTRELR